VAIWIDQRLDGDHSLKQIANKGGAAWWVLKKGLATTLAFLKDESEGPAEDFGLPVGNALQGVRAVQEARAARRKLEAEEAEGELTQSSAPSPR
jgi:hypothetical protein